MINAINNAFSANNTTPSIKSNSVLGNISPNELETLVDEMYKKGEITLKDTLAFKPLSTNNLAKDLNVNADKIKIKYFSEVWDNPNTKRDLLTQYKNIFNQQISNGENIESSKNGLRVLSIIEKKYSFGSIFKSMI